MVLGGFTVGELIAIEIANPTEQFLTRNALCIGSGIRRGRLAWLRLSDCKPIVANPHQRSGHQDHMAYRSCGLIGIHEIDGRRLNWVMDVPTRHGSRNACWDACWDA